ncbi:hypothetical protein FBUS_08954 [Fasciolopsis buskii]|uniref:Uncharacterized protein n=1 Tax=Fasciolopsis buskii TaxID=27845 RepID=A0A8E0VLU7_9TREM|nr:hypothetical protein FBUS_08954 [Fasciolopsis buski]
MSKKSASVDNEFLENNAFEMMEDMVATLFVRKPDNLFTAIFSKVLEYSECNVCSLDGIVKELECLPYQSPLLFTKCKTAYQRVTQLESLRPPASIGDLTASLFKQICRTCYGTEMVIDSLRLRNRFYISPSEFASIISTAKNFQEFCKEFYALYSRFCDSPSHLYQIIEVAIPQGSSRVFRNEDVSSKTRSKSQRSMSQKEFMERAVCLFIKNVSFSLKLHSMIVRFLQLNITYKM